MPSSGGKRKTTEGSTAGRAPLYYQWCCPDLAPNSLLRKGAEFSRRPKLEALLIC